MKTPAPNSDSVLLSFPEQVSAESRLEAKEIPEYFNSDLHDDDSVMMAEIYGEDFQKIWKKTHKKWWV